MSILIKGLGMPKRCLDCPCFDHDYAECQVRVTATRENGCPLVEIPTPHGDLVDINTKITLPMYDDEHEEWSEETVVIEEMLAMADEEVPTVIEAEEQEHDCGKSEEEKE